MESLLVFGALESVLATHIKVKRATIDLRGENLRRVDHSKNSLWINAPMPMRLDVPRSAQQDLASPSVYADIDRLKAEKVGLTPTDVFDTLQVYLGSQYVNDFNFLGRTYEVIAQADARFRRDKQDLMALKARNAAGEMVPSGTVAQLKDTTISYRVPRYNLYPAAEVQGVAAPGVAAGTALHRMEALAATVLPAGIGYEWTEIAYQQEQQGTPTMLVFGAAALFVFLMLAANYESWKLPLAVVLIVPMCLLASVTGLMFRGMPIDILAQIGFVVLVGLAAKNAILIVEFAHQAQEASSPAAEAAVSAAQRWPLCGERAWGC